MPSRHQIYTHPLFISALDGGEHSVLGTDRYSSELNVPFFRVLVFRHTNVDNINLLSQTVQYINNYRHYS